MRLLVCLLTLMCPWCCVAQEAKPPSAAEIREAKVYETIGEMISRRDELMKKFAVVLHGEHCRVGDGDPAVGPVVYARVVDQSRSFDLEARYEAIAGQSESGSEVVRIGKEYKSRNYMFTHEYTPKPPDAKLSAWLEENSAAGHDPYDDYFFAASGIDFRGDFQAMERSILGRYTLDKTVLGTEGKLVSYWSNNSNKYTDIRLRIVFAPSAEMMVVRNRLDNISPGLEMFQELRITWKRHGKTLLPYRIETARSSVNDKNIITEYVFRCYWLVGDEVPDEIFTSKDHLAALIDHFKITRSRLVNGKRVYTEHKLPSDLHDYDDKKKKKK